MLVEWRRRLWSHRPRGSPSALFLLLSRQQPRNTCLSSLLNPTQVPDPLLSSSLLRKGDQLAAAGLTVRPALGKQETRQGWGGSGCTAANPGAQVSRVLCPYRELACHVLCLRCLACPRHHIIWNFRLPRYFHMVLETWVNSDELNVTQRGEQCHKQGHWFSCPGITLSTARALDDFTSHSPARRRFMTTMPEGHVYRLKVTDVMKLTQGHTAGEFGARLWIQGVWLQMLLLTSHVQWPGAFFLQTVPEPVTGF